MLPKGWYKVRSSDYEDSGFDKGHLSPSEDGGRSDEDNSATFLMMNMIPQAPDNNRVVWLQFEQYCRGLTKQGKELYIVAGGSGSGGTSSMGEMTLLKGKIAVPATVWKIVLVLDRSGIEPKDVSVTNSRTIAITVPNQQGVKSKPWKAYVTYVDEVEKLTGYDFFSNVPKLVQGVSEAKMNDR